MRLRSRSPSIERKRRDLTSKPDSRSSDEFSDPPLAADSGFLDEDTEELVNKIDLPKRQIKTNVGTGPNKAPVHIKTTANGGNEDGAHQSTGAETFAGSEDMGNERQPEEDDDRDRGRGRTRTKPRIVTSELPGADAISLMGFNPLASASSDKDKHPADAFRQISVRHRPFKDDEQR